MFRTLLAKKLKVCLGFKTVKKPVTAVLGGSKVSSKITVIENILDKSRSHDYWRWNDFYLCEKRGWRKIGNSICEDDKMELALNFEIS
jgi:phosphoglycerate kinase